MVARFYKRVTVCLLIGLIIYSTVGLIDEVEASKRKRKKKRYACINISILVIGYVEKMLHFCKNDNLFTIVWEDQYYTLERFYLCTLC